MTVPQGSEKPKKPYPEFPLTAHPNGNWCKRINGRTYYFGPWADWRGALERYKRQIDDLRAGREPTVTGVTVKYLCNLWLDAKKAQADAGELSRLTWGQYKRTCGRVVEVFGRNAEAAGLRPHDFERLRAVLARTNGPRALGVQIQHVRMVFRYGYESGVLDVPVRFGPQFRKPSQAVIRRLRASKPPRLFAPEELRAILQAAPPVLRAMTLLGVNCGFGNADCGNLPLAVLDLTAGWVTFPRPKTGISRRAKLWPETVAALRAYLAVRPATQVYPPVQWVFVTPTGLQYNGGKGFSTIGHEFRRLLKRLGLYRPGLCFYALRHTFSTVGEGCGDHIAVGAVMGHVDTSMSAHYRERIDDTRLSAVAEHVRAWLFGKG